VNPAQAHIHDACLTRREIEVMVGIAAGNTAKEIAADLGITDSTVSVHRTHLYRKLGVGIHNVVHLTHLAIAAGLVPVKWEGASSQ